MERVTSHHAQPNLWISPESILVNAIVQLEPRNIDLAMIRHEAQQIRLRLRHELYPFPSLSQMCHQLPARGALHLCNHYFSHLTNAADVVSWLPPFTIAELAGTLGIRAFTESATPMECEEAVTQLHYLLNWSPGAVAEVESLLSSFPQTPQSRLLRDVACGVMGATLLQKIVICHGEQNNLTPDDLLLMTATYLETLAHAPLAPSFIDHINDRIAELIAEFGVRAIGRCQRIGDFERLKRAVDRLLVQTDRRRTQQFLEALPRTLDRALLLKIVEGVCDSIFFMEIVIHTSDQIFTPQEWNHFGNRCLECVQKPARLWLAIGANATTQNLIETAGERVRIALNGEFPWSHRRSCLLRRLIANLNRHNHTRARGLESKAIWQKWMTPPLKNRHRLSLTDQALLLRNSDTLTEQEALQLWRLGAGCDHWPQEMRTEWLTLHCQIASRLDVGDYTTAVFKKWTESQQSH